MYYAALGPEEAIDFGWSGRRVWDSNPRGRVNALAVFKTAAIGH